MVVVAAINIGVYLCKTQDSHRYKDMKVHLDALGVAVCI